MESISELKKICQNGKRNKNFLLAKGYTFHRNISIYVTYVLLRFAPRVTPNIVTLGAIIFGLIGVFIMLLKGPFIFLGFFLVYVSFILDKVDGELARYKTMFSIQGIYLDELYHIFVTAFFFICVFFVANDSAALDLKAICVLLVLVFFSILNRYNRKLPVIIFNKTKQKYKKDIFMFHKNDVIVKFLNNTFFKVFSVVDRFDVILFTLLGCFLIDIFFVDALLPISVTMYTLGVLAIFNCLYFCRWALILYFKKLDDIITSFHESDTM